jgi:hypothetical protein
MTGAPLPVRCWVDLAVLTTLTVLALLGFSPVFAGGGYLLAGTGGLVIGTTAALVAARLGLGIVLSAALAVGAYVIAGPGLAMPTRAFSGFTAWGESTLDVLLGTVFAWRDVVNLAVPVGAPDHVGVLPYVAGWIAGLVSGTIVSRWYATRPRGPVASAVGVLAPLALFVTSVLTGTQEPFLALPRGVAVAALAIVWLSWRPLPEAGTAARAAVLTRRLRGVAIVAVVGIGGGALIGGVLAPAPESRFVLRDEIDPPFDPLRYPSPLAGFRHYVIDLEDEVLFSVDGLDGEDATIRIATMDTYTGKLWAVADAEHQPDGSGTFQLVTGSRLPDALLSGPSTPREITVEIAGYHDVWMPGLGDARSVVFDADAALPSDALRYNRATGVLIDTERLREGDRYVLSADVSVVDPSEVEGAALAALELPVPVDVPKSVGSLASEWTSGLETPYLQLRALEKIFQESYLSHGSGHGATSLAGHGADRLTTLLEEPDSMVGDGEQYAAAFALMARSLGIPARVVLGFRPEVVEGAPTEVRGADADAWIEVPFAGIGWVPFFPTPDDVDAPEQQEPQPRTTPQPQIQQPPVDDDDESDQVSPVEVEDPERPPQPPVFPAWVLPVLLTVGIPSLVVALPLLLVAAFKRRGRGGRRTTGTGDRRAAGAWDELIDRYAELGYAGSVTSTRAMLARELEAQVPQTGPDATPGRVSPGTSGDARSENLATLRAVADAADRSVFSGSRVDPAAVDELWRHADALAAAAQRSAGWLRRGVSRLRIHPRRDGRPVLPHRPRERVR